MKVLFAVNNDNISEAIVRKYQQDYKEILSYKNVYYFNAILKEIQKDKTYNRIVISEDLEPFANNNYDLIDKFLLEKMDKIGKEVSNTEGIEIILVCTDRRKKGEDILAKYFSAGIYNGILGEERSIDAICSLINQPRTKKDAKLYYKVDVDNGLEQEDAENSVSEAEVQNILAHYKRLGKNEDKYVESFNNIITQYTDAQLKIIIRCLPIQVRSVLEARSPKYQELVTFAGQDANKNYNNYNPPKVKEKKNNIEDEDALEITMLEEEANRKKTNKPIIVPTKLNTEQVKRVLNTPTAEKKQYMEVPKLEENETEDKIDVLNQVETIERAEIEDNIESEPSKKGRGRPRKYPIQEVEIPTVKRGRGRPKKFEPEAEVADKMEEIDSVAILDTEEDSDDLFNLDSNQPELIQKVEKDVDLFNMEEEPELQNSKNEEPQNDVNLFSMEQEEPEKDENDIDLFNIDEEKEEEHKQEIVQTNIPQMSNGLGTVLTRDKKVVIFVGTTKNGTSFVVNNTATMLANMGLSTAILDMTTTKNDYYIYTNNEETLRTKAKECIGKLENNMADGIQVNKNLTVYTSLPGEQLEYNAEKILTILLQKHAVVLIDADFTTPVDFFAKAQEVYLVQTLDVLTIQPLTAFLRNLKSKNVLEQEKLKIVINKYQKIKGLDMRTLIGGIAYYNDPAMSFMTELFNKDSVKYCQIPFELENYGKYLESLVTCSISLNGYTKQLMLALKELTAMVYPLMSKQTYSPIGNKRKDHFSSEVNDTLRKMKNTY